MRYLARLFTEDPPDWKGIQVNPATLPNSSKYIYPNGWRADRHRKVVIIESGHPIVSYSTDHTTILLAIVFLLMFAIINTLFSLSIVE